MAKVSPSDALSAIVNSNKVVLTPSDVAPVLGVAPYSINQQAMNNVYDLGFAVSKIGTRVIIPRKPFLDWIGLEEEKQDG